MARSIPLPAHASRALLSDGSGAQAKPEAAPARATQRGNGQYRALVRRKKLMLGGLTIALALSVIADMGLGPARYSAREVLLALAGSDEVSNQVSVVIWQIR
ncbi:MAG: hypothetical protein ACJ8DW_06480, partial [Microvirga sp.]